MQINLPPATMKNLEQLATRTGVSLETAITILVKQANEQQELRDQIETKVTPLGEEPSEIENPWRGILAIDHPHAPTNARSILIENLQALPPREPVVNLSWHRRM